MLAGKKGFGNRAFTMSALGSNVLSYLPILHSGV